MRSVPSLLRTVVLVVAAGLLSSCATTSVSGALPQLPSLSSVVGGRFVSRVELDDGDLVVTPAGRLKARVSAKTAQALFRAADVVNGAYRFAVLGLGMATVSAEVSPLTTTTTTESGGAANSGTGATTTTHATTSTTSTTTTTASGTTTTDAATGPASTGSAGSTSSTATTAAAPTTPPLPRYDDRLAWVGIAWGTDCPTPPGEPRLATRYVAVVIDARTGRSVIAYTSRGSLACSGPVLPPSVSRPDELVSVPWQPVGPHSTAVRVTMPPCSTYFGWTDVPGANTAAVQVVASTPFDPECGSAAPDIQIVDDVIPLGNNQTKVPHAVVGPVDALRTLPGG